MSAKVVFARLALALALTASPFGALAGPRGGGGMGHTNGPPPVGKPATHGDTDRGNSEGQGHNDKHPNRLVARVASLSGSTLVVRMPDGRLRTFTASPSVLGQVRPALGANVVLFTNGGVVVQRVLPADVTFTGVVSKMSKDQVTFRLPNGQLRTITVARAAVAHMMPGRRLTVVSHDGGVTATTIRPPLK